MEAGGVEPCNPCICNWLRIGRKVSGSGRNLLSSGQLQDAKKGQGVEKRTEAGRNEAPLGQMKCRAITERDNAIVKPESAVSPELSELITLQRQLFQFNLIFNSFFSMREVGFVVFGLYPFYKLQRCMDIEFSQW